MIYENEELLHNVEAVENKAIMLKMSRIPLELRPLLNPNAQERATRPANAEIRFNMNGDYATITLQNETGAALVEVYRGAFLHSWHLITDEPTQLVLVRDADQSQQRQRQEVNPQPFDPALWRVMLPWQAQMGLVEVDGDLTPPRPDQLPALRYLAYGSSITQGNAAIRPGGTYVSRIAQMLGADLINLGFGGGCHCEPAVADYIAGREDWDIATLELGINMLGGFSVDEFTSLATDFIETVAHAHPDKWVFVTDIFSFGADLPSTDGQKANAFRQIVRNAVAEASLPKLIHVPGRELLPTLDGLTVDLVHPAPSGMEMIAHNFVARMREYF